MVTLAIAELEKVEQLSMTKIARAIGLSVPIICESLRDSFTTFPCLETSGAPCLSAKDRRSLVQTAQIASSRPGTAGTLRDFRDGWLQRPAALNFPSFQETDSSSAARHRKLFAIAASRSKRELFSERSSSIHRPPPMPACTSLQPVANGHYPRSRPPHRAVSRPLETASQDSAEDNTGTNRPAAAFADACLPSVVGPHT